MNAEMIRSLVLTVDALGAEPSDADRAARNACEQVAYGIFALTDFGRAVATLELYDETIDMEIDGVRFDRASRVERSRKREANTARKTRHIVSNFLFRRIDARSACALSLVTIFIEDDRGVRGATPIAVADCADWFERGVDGRWRVTYRSLRTIAGAAH